MVKHYRGGKLIYVDHFKNLMMDVGLNDMLDSYWGNASHLIYVGLTDATPTSPAAGDTMASHSGWVEDQNYSEGVRQTLSVGTAASKSIDNSAAPATFSMNATTTIGGAFLTDSNVKGGTTGILIAAGDFSGGNRAVINTDVIEVTVTLTAADDGV